MLFYLSREKFLYIIQGINVVFLRVQIGL